MRTRKQIMNEISDDYCPMDSLNARVLMEVLLDIRELLKKERDQK